MNIALSGTGVATPAALIGALENPSEGEEVSGITTIHGWALDGKKVTLVELYFDGTFATNIPYGGSRDDVKAAFPQYPNADLSGFGIIFNYSILTAGAHTILVRLHNEDGATMDLTAAVTVVGFGGEFVTNVSPISFTLPNVAVTVGGTTANYDITIQWSNATQHFEITGVTPK